MTYKYLFIFVEGKDDKEFFERIIKPKLNIKYDTIQIVEYSNLSDKKINELIKSINSYADYIFITDNDNCPCITTRKEKDNTQYQQLNISNIIVSVEVIEGWYLSGLNKEGIKKLRMDNDLLKRASFKPDKITKENFIRLQKPFFDSIIDFRQEILHLFDFETAKQNNASFKYFVDKYIA